MTAPTLMHGSNTLLVVLALFGLAIAALYAWGLSLAKRRGSRALRFATHGVLLGATSALAGFALTLQRVAAARTDSVTSSDTEHYARGISSAFGVSAIPIALGNLLLLVSVLVLLVGAVRHPSA